jgi:hypothetical protein
MLFGIGGSANRYDRRMFEYEGYIADTLRNP